MATTLFNEIPAWYFQMILPVGFLLMAFRFLIHMIGDRIQNSGVAEVQNKQITTKNTKKNEIRLKKKDKRKKKK
jgi:TRAP-type C4-dicarboxylate transport system permease small subunit